MTTKNWQPVIDLTNLRELTDNDYTLISKYINIFTNGLSVHLSGIKNGIDQKNIDLIYKTLHVLKPQVELMGIDELAGLIQAHLINLKSQSIPAPHLLTELDMLMNKLEISKVELNILSTQLNRLNENR